ncbi:MAG: prepilin-type N-terminal cleavage/methylation domain-containing protein [Elusimicrobia bacterium]|nr:prepilin-type N-terminal cleavage/methylation domain-containing protein [Elusimicrobiota bacterium]
MESRGGRGEGRGFTLIELLVVILIVGILASIALPQYFKVVERARVTEALALAGAIRSGEERYLAKKSSYNLGTPPTGMDINVPILKFFGETAGGAINVSSNDAGTGYKINFTRQGTVSNRYGTNYKVHVCQDGTIWAEAGTGTGASATNIIEDLLPDGSSAGTGTTSACGS